MKTIEDYYAVVNFEGIGSDAQGRRRLERELGQAPEPKERLNERERLLYDLLSALPPRERWAVERMTGVWTGEALEGMCGRGRSFAEVGEELGVDATACEVLYHRALQRMREALWF